MSCGCFYYCGAHLVNNPQIAFLYIVGCFNTYTLISRPPQTPANQKIFIYSCTFSLKSGRTQTSFQNIYSNLFRPVRHGSGICPRVHAKATQITPSIKPIVKHRPHAAPVKPASSLSHTHALNTKHSDSGAHTHMHAKPHPSFVPSCRPH